MPCIPGQCSDIHVRACGLSVMNAVSEGQIDFVVELVMGWLLQDGQE
jgi:hypothetical protein